MHVICGVLIYSKLRGCGASIALHFLAPGLVTDDRDSGSPQLRLGEPKTRSQPLTLSPLQHSFTANGEW